MTNAQKLAGDTALSYDWDFACDNYVHCVSSALPSANASLSLARKEIGTSDMFSAFAGSGPFLRGNLHCHSTGSDGDMSPERVCHFYREAGYDFICLSDHFLDRYNFPVTDTAPFRTDAFTTLLGSEIHTGKTKLTRFGICWPWACRRILPQPSRTRPG